MNSIFQKVKINLILDAIILIGLFISLIGIYDYILGGYDRLTSIFYWPNPMASFLLLILPLSFYKLVYGGRNIFCFSYYLVVNLVLVASFLLTDSRGGFLSLGIVMILYLFFKRKKLFKNLFFVILLFFLGVGGGQVVNGLKGEFVYESKRDSYNGAFSDTSSKIRLNYWQSSWEMFLDYPLLGVGWGNFEYYYPKYQIDIISSGKYPHNMYLEVLVEWGIFVFLLVILVIGEFVVRGFLYGLRNPGLINPLYLGLLAFLIHLMVDISNHYLLNIYLFFILFLYYFYLLYRNKVFSLTRLQKKVLFINLAGICFLMGFYTYLDIRFDYIMGKARSLEYEGKYLQAQEEYLKGYEVTHDHVFLRRVGVMSYILGITSQDEPKQSDYLEHALGVAERLIQINQIDSLNYELIAKVYLALGQIDEAEKYTKQAISLNRFVLRYYADLIRIYVIGGDFQKASDLGDLVLARYDKEEIKNKKNYVIMGEVSGFNKELETIKILINSHY